MFRHGGEEKIYLSSADFMTRNLSFRVETTFPIYDPAIKEEIKEYLATQLADNVKARLLSDQETNAYVTKGDLAIRSQLETYYALKRRQENLTAAEEAAETMIEARDAAELLRVMEEDNPTPPPLEPEAGL